MKKGPSLLFFVILVHAFSAHALDKQGLISLHGYYSNDHLLNIVSYNDQASTFEIVASANEVVEVIHGVDWYFCGMFGRFNCLDFCSKGRLAAIVQNGLIAEFDDNPSAELCTTLFTCNKDGTDIEKIMDLPAAEHLIMRSVHCSRSSAKCLVIIGRELYSEVEYPESLILVDLCGKRDKEEIYSCNDWLSAAAISDDGNMAAFSSIDKSQWQHLIDCKPDINDSEYGSKKIKVLKLDKGTAETVLDYRNNEWIVKGLTFISNSEILIIADKLYKEHFDNGSVVFKSDFYLMKLCLNSMELTELLKTEGGCLGDAVVMPDSSIICTLVDDYGRCCICTVQQDGSGLEKIAVTEKRLKDAIHLELDH